MQKQLLLFIFATMSFLSAYSQKDTTMNDPKLAVFQLDSLVTQLEETNRPWLPFLRGQNVLTGLYKLSKETTDRQQPHDTDEVYYVVSGKAKFIANGKEVTVSAGSILFVKAEIEHRFFDIEEDLLMVVFFDQ